MRKTIKDLESKLKQAEENENRYYQNWQKLKDEKEEKERKEMSRLNSENERFFELTSTLREIIRWQINPDTARTPFTSLFKEGDKVDVRNGRGF